jgi:hypothetical protein
VGASSDPETIQVLGADKGQHHSVRDIIASRILTAAQNGERDPDKLCERA